LRAQNSGVFGLNCGSGFGYLGEFCGELLLRVRRAQGGGRGRRRRRVCRQSGPAALVGVWGQLGFDIKGTTGVNFVVLQLNPARAAGVGPVVKLGGFPTSAVLRPLAPAKSPVTEVNLSKFATCSFCLVEFSSSFWFVEHYMLIKSLAMKLIIC